MKAGFSGLLCVVLVSVLAGCLSEQRLEERRLAFLASIDYQEITVENLAKGIQSIATDGHGFIVTAYVLSPDPNYWQFDIGDKPPEPDVITINFFTMVSKPKFVSGNRVSLQSRDFYEKNRDIPKQLEVDRQYTVYIAVLKEDGFGKKSEKYNGIITKIEGLRSVEEVAAAAKAKEEAERKAREEANRYDASKFAIVPSDFEPARYAKIDLFTAVSNVEKQTPTGKLHIFVASPSGVFSDHYVSDVVFIYQNGTDILFRTDDDAISQEMKVDARSGLTPNQKVRVYYIAIDRLTEWRVVAIERL